MRLMPGRQAKDLECKTEVSSDPFSLEEYQSSVTDPMSPVFSLSVVAGYDPILCSSEHLR